MIAVGLVFICALTVLSCALVLIFHEHYNDGVVGKIGLILLALAAAGRVASIVDAFVDGAQLPAFPSTALLVWCGLALFLSRHYYRFRCWHLSGAGAWTPLAEITRVRA